MLASSGLSRKNFDKLLRQIRRMQRNPAHMAGVALVEFACDVDTSMRALNISEKALAARSGMTIHKLKLVLEPPMKSNTRATDLSKVAKALGTEVSIRLLNKI